MECIYAIKNLLLNLFSCLLFSSSRLVFVTEKGKVKLS